MTDHAPHHDVHGDGADVDVLVHSPRFPEPRAFTFRKNSRVRDDAQQAATEFGYVGGAPTFQNAAGDLLDRDKTLAAAHVKDGDVLELVDVGGGV